MQVVRNIGFVKGQKRRGRRLTALGVAFLTFAFFLVFFQQGQGQGQLGVILLSYAAMMSGFILFNLGLQTVTKFASNARKPRNDQALDKGLERLNDRHTLIHYSQLGKRVPEHLLVHNGGVLVLTVRELPGQISVNGRRWRRGGNLLTRFTNSSGPQLGNPTVENEGDVALVREYLAANELPATVDGVIVFTHPAVTVRVTDSPVDVTDLDGLPDYIRGLSQDQPALTGKERLAIIEALSQGQDLEQVTLRGERRKRAA